MAKAKKKLDDALLVRLYCEQPLFVDHLPYTVEFDVMVVAYNKKHQIDPTTHQELWRRIVGLRKAKKLVRKAKKVKVIKRNQPQLFS
jgi:hypothetical protein